jgi:hypothetical protein
VQQRQRQPGEPGPRQLQLAAARLVRRVGVEGTARGLVQLAAGRLVRRAGVEGRPGWVHLVLLVLVHLPAGRLVHLAPARLPVLRDRRRRGLVLLVQLGDLAAVVGLVLAAGGWCCWC